MRDSLAPLVTTAVQVLVSMASVTVPVFAPVAAAELGVPKPRHATNQER